MTWLENLYGEVLGPGGWTQPTTYEGSASNKILTEREVGWYDATRHDLSHGRRLRALAWFLRPIDGDWRAITMKGTDIKRPFFSGKTRRLTYVEAYNILHRGKSPMVQAAREFLSSQPLREGADGRPTHITAIPEDYTRPPRDPSLHNALQDLGYEILEDIHEACAAFDDPDVYYPGVDEGIDPVTDDHVNLVIWGMQRELNRELRPRIGTGAILGLLPAVVLSDLPWRIQRALVERRRLRYQQYGIGREQWERGTWSLFDIPEDWDFVPRRHVRMLGAQS